MIQFLKSQGFKYTENEDLLNREFREVSKSISVDEDLSTFADVVFSTTKVYELFLNEKAFREDIVRTVLTDLRDETAVVTGSADIETLEQGYLITFTFIVGD